VIEKEEIIVLDELEQAKQEGQKRVEEAMEINNRVGTVETKTATIEETLDVLFGGTT
jgi:hypothetical protein